MSSEARFSKINNSGFQISWEIENYSLLRKENDEAFLSPVVNVDIFGNSVWQLILYPKGEAAGPGWVSLFLKRCEDDRNECTINLSCRIYIWKEDGSWVSNFLDEVPYRKNEQYGWSNFVEVSKLAKEMGRWTDDNLTIKCEMQQNYLERKPAIECFAHTRVFVETRAATWTVKYPENAEWKVNKTVSFEELDLRFDVVLTSPDDDVIVDVYKKKTDRFAKRLVRCNMKLMDVEGEVFHSVTDSHIYKSEDTDVWNIRAFFSKSMLKAEGDHLLKNDEFNLEIVFKTSALTTETIASQYIYDREYDEEIYESYNTVAALKGDLARFFLSDKHSDVILKVGEEALSAHKPILSARSPVFADMFNHETTKEEEKSVINIINLDVRTLKCLLQFIYSGRTEILDFKMVSKLMIAADAYQIPSLKKKCSSFLKAIMCDYNVSEMALLCDHVGDSDLKSRVVDYIKTRQKIIFAPDEWLDILKENKSNADKAEK